MTELIKVSTDLLFQAGDACEVIVLKADNIKPPMELKKPFKGRLSFQTEDYINVLTEFKASDTSPISLQVTHLGVAMQHFRIAVLITPEEAKRRIKQLIDLQRKHARAELRKTLKECDSGEEFLLKKYNLT